MRCYCGAVAIYRVGRHGFCFHHVDQARAEQSKIEQARRPAKLLERAPSRREFDLRPWWTRDKGQR